MAAHPAFKIGQLIHHRLFGYRGVVVDIDHTYSLSDEWYDHMAKTRPPRDQPWYRVLVHGTSHETYVAERNLEPDPSGAPVEHPLIRDYFDDMRDGYYVRSHNLN